MTDEEYKKFISGKDLAGYRVVTWWGVDFRADAGKVKHVEYSKDQDLARQQAESEGLGAPHQVQVLTKDGKEGIPIALPRIRLADPVKIRATMRDKAQGKLSEADKRALGLA